MNAEIGVTSSQESHDRWLDKPVFGWWPALTIEKLLIVLIIAITLLTRFYDLGARTMSHDEVNHVVPSYTIETYVYDPVTHGPFQFHAIAFSYFLFGDSDFSARVPAALFGVAVVAFTLFAWKRYLGRVGALIAGFLFMISPYILFYSRYTRNEIFIVFWGLVMLWLFLRYLESGEKKFLLWLTLIIAMHYADKATSYIFTAEALIFLAVLFILEALHKPWSEDRIRRNFLICLLVMLLAVLGLGGFYLLSADGLAGIPIPALLVLGVMLLAGLVLALFNLIRGLGWGQIRLMRSFDLVVLQLLLVLPLLTALPVRLLGFDPLDYSQAGIIRSVVVFVLLAVISVVLGLIVEPQGLAQELSHFLEYFHHLLHHFFHAW